MVNSSWTDFLGAEAAGLGSWITLPETGWGSLIAYLAGPSNTRRLQPQPARETRYRVEGSSGDVSEWQEPSSPADEAESLAAINDYLIHRGIPELPTLVTWQVRVAGVSEDEFFGRLNTAIDRTDDLTSLGGDVAALRSELETLLP